MSIKFESFKGTGGGAVTGGLVYKGSYNATTSSPSLVTATKGDFYIVSVAGALAGITLNVGDHIVFNQDAANPVTSAMFDIIDNTDAVASVNTQTGVVVLDTDDIAETATNQYFTSARFDTQLATKDTDDVAEGSSNLYYTNARFDTQLATKSTTNVAEGANLYYTNARFDTQLATKDTDNLTEGSSNLYFTSPRFTSELATKDTSNLTEGTNLYHTNTRVDARIALANANDLNDVSYTAGVGINGQVLTYVHANNRWEAAAASGGISSVNGDTGPTVVLDSDDVAEGSSNLYYTNARFDTQLATKSTTNVAEGTNLYYTNARFDTQLATKDTDDVAEGSSNLYYTNARFDTQLATKSTTNVAEGTNLYYTNARFDTQLATKTGTSNGDILLLDAVGLPAVNGSQLTGLTTNIVEDTSPQLGGSLDVNGQDIVSVSNGAIELAPDGTGKVTIKGNATSGSGQIVLNCEQNTHGISLKGPPHSAAASYTLTFPNTDGNADQVLKSDGSGNLDWVDQASGGGGLTYQARTTASHSPLTPAADYHYSINADNATFVVNLPALSSLTDGQQIRFKLQARGNAAYDVTINRAGSDTIDGATSQTLSVTYSSITLVVGSTEWEIV